MSWKWWTRGGETIRGSVHCRTDRGALDSTLSVEVEVPVDITERTVPKRREEGRPNTPECEDTLGLQYQERDVDHVSFVWSIEVITKKL